MPKVIGYTPSWLSRPSHGFELFNNRAKEPSQNGTDTQTSDDSAPSRTIAVRGTEIFYATGNEIRWADLSSLRELDRAKATDDFGAGDEDRSKRSYRVLKASGSRKIKQLSVSLNGLYMAIISSHTVHVAVLPDSSLLSSKDDTPLKLKSCHLGPTTHVIERSAIASALWHPLSSNGDCLVTVTTDAVVRLWELDRANRWSFDKAALAIDLKKLANGFSSVEDFSPSKFGSSIGFSPDSFEMEVASACFGASSASSEGSWSPMTLWVAMGEGDIYALCPLLPSRFEISTSSLLRLLSTQKIDYATCESFEGVPDSAKRRIKQQQAWLSDIERQLEDDDSDASLSTIVLKRPALPSPIPKLQGPFQLSPDPDQIFDITDVCALAADEQEVSESDDESFVEDDNTQQSLETLCLATSDGKVHVCVSLSTIELEWLPHKKAHSVASVDEDADKHEMLVLESISLTDSESSSSTSWPVFTPDATSTSRAFVSHTGGVAQIDFSPYQSNISDELQAEGDTGVEFRIGVMVDNTSATCTSCMSINSQNPDTKTAAELIACVNIFEPGLGHFVLTVSDDQPTAVTLDSIPAELDESDDESDDSYDVGTVIDDLTAARPSYQAAQAFWQESTFPNFLETHAHSRSRRALQEEVRLNPTTLDLLMSAHRVLSTETHRLGIAAADLFARCVQMQDEFKEQLNKAKEVVERINNVTREKESYEQNGEDGDEEDMVIGDSVEGRLDNIRINGEAIMQRYEGLRSKVAKLNKRPFSEKEREWKGEVERLGGLVLQKLEDSANGDGEQESVHDHRHETWQRFDEVKVLHEELSQQYQQQQKRDEGPESVTFGDSVFSERSASSTKSESNMNVALDRRRARSEEIEQLLERQAALVEATKEKLRRLQGLVVS